MCEEFVCTNKMSKTIHLQANVFLMDLAHVKKEVPILEELVTTRTLVDLLAGLLLLT